MKNKWTILLMLGIILLGVHKLKAEWITITGSQKDAKVQLIASDYQNTELQFNLEGFNLNTINTNLGELKHIQLGNTSPLLIKGAPDVPKTAVSIIIPDKNSMEVEITNALYRDYENINLVPSKGNLYRDTDPKKVPYEYGDEYSKNGFFPGKLADLQEPFIARDYRGQSIWIYPFQYNPITKVLRVYYSMTIRVYQTNRPGINELVRTKSIEKINQQFHNIYNRFFLNYTAPKYTPVDETGCMLILAPSQFIPAMQPFIQWKKKIGIPTEIVDLATVGTTTTAIKTFVTNYYNTHDMAFLLFVGDAEHIPPITGTGVGGPSDNAYGYILGNDHYQEILIGRFSSQSVADVQTQVQRMIDYEQNPNTSNNWLKKTLGIASDQGPGDDNEYDYQHVRNMQTDLIGFTYATPTIEMFDGSQGGNDLPGNPTPTMVGNAINAGVGIILYTGHGSDNSFVTSGFSSSNVNALTNNGMLPFIWSVACVNGNFIGQTCFAEAWLRATNNNQPSGAIGTMMSTINQSWNPPMQGQDEMVDILVETYPNNIKRTFGGLSINGCFQMNEESGAAGAEMTDTWTLFGDPSLMVRTNVPTQLTATHASVALLGSSQFTVNCPVAGARVALTMNGEILGTAIVSGGTATVTFPALSAIGTITIAITAFNYIPYITDINIIAPSGPYVLYNQMQINDANGNNNGIPEYGENISLNFTLKNVGVNAANGVTATISSTSPYVTITDNIETFGNIAAGDTVTKPSAFALTIAQHVPDQTTIPFTVHCTDINDSSWNSSFNIIARAPILQIGNMTIANDPNNNGRLDPGETLDLKFVLNNNGGAICNNPFAYLTGNSPYLTINTDLVDLDPIPAAGNRQVTFSVSAHPVTLQGTEVSVIMTAYDVDSVSKTQNIIIGTPPEKPIGNGTVASNQFPFYTYYENNKSQMLYLGSEIGSGTQIIKEIAFDIKQLGTTVTTLNNLTIKFKKTTQSQFASAFDNMTGAKTVFTAASYAMPTTTGWCVFDIVDYTFTGPDTNLIVEVVWGDNGAWSSTYYKVNCTDVGVPRVAYGYSDTQTPPNYNGTSNNRPNIKLFFLANGGGTAYNVPFKVIDGNTSTPISTAKIKIGSLQKPVNSNGVTVFNLIEGNYAYTATAPLYNPINNQAFTVANADTIVIQLSSLPLRNIIFTVVDSATNNAIAGATVTIGTNTQITDNSGNASFGLYDGTYTYTISANNYQTKTGTLVVTGNANTTVLLSSTIGIIELTNISAMVYPNPAKEKLFVISDRVIKQLKIVSLDGRLITDDIKANTNTVEINVSNIENGAYLLYIITNEGMAIKKVSIIK